MNRTGRVLVALGLVAVASAGVYGQTARNAVVQDFEIFNYKDTYRASMCADRSFMPGAPANNFIMRVKRPLANNWYEVEVASTFAPDTKQLGDGAETLRINAAQLCYVQPLR